MKSKLKVFKDNEKEITERIIGSVVKHFVLIHTGQQTVHHDAMKAISRTAKLREELRDYLQDTIKKTETFFSNPKLAQDYTDHQCDLILSIYRDYSKTKESK